jgi:hypothetical protein
MGLADVLVPLNQVRNSAHALARRTPHCRAARRRRHARAPRQGRAAKAGLRRPRARELTEQTRLRRPHAGLQEGRNQATAEAAQAQFRGLADFFQILRCRRLIAKSQSCDFKIASS